jgi:peptide/nickel transport system substrate-binding protein
MSGSKSRIARWWLTLLVVAAVLGSALVGLLAATVGTAGAASPAPTGDRIVRIGWTQDPENLNPFVGVQGTDYEIWHLNYDFLVGFDAASLKPTPELATKWSVSADGKTWTFDIRQGVKWQDGVPLTAKDVAFTFDYIVDNNLTNLSIYTDGIVHATALSDTQVTIECKAPKSNMLQMVVPIIPEHIWSKVPGKLASSSYINKPPIIGSGPFQVIDYKSGQYVKLQANKNYWGGAPKIDQLIFQMYTNPMNMTSELKNGTIDGAVDVPAAQFAGLKGQPGITTSEGTSWRFTELGFNCYANPNSMGNPVLLDTKFRQALEWAVDRQKIVDVAMNGYAKVGSTLLVPYSQYAWTPPASDQFTYDPAKAAALLDAAGYKMGPNGIRLDKTGKPISLRLFVTTDSPENQTAAKLVAGWFQNVGIGVKLTVMDSGTLLAAQYHYNGNTYAPDYDMYIWYWTADVDPYFMLGIYTPAQVEGWNDCLWTDPAYTKLNGQQATTIDVAQRKLVTDQMQQMFYQASPYIIFTYPYQLEAYNTNKWTGWTHAPQNVAGWEGSVLYDYNNVDTFKNLAPNVGKVAGGASHTGLIAGVIIAVLAVGAVVVLALRRRRPGGPVEEG